MRKLVVPIALSFAPLAAAQVATDRPVVLSGAPEQRAVHGLAPPTAPDALVQMGWALSGQATWAHAEIIGDTIMLTQPLAGDGPLEGQLVHFMLPDTLAPAMHVRFGGGAALPFQSAAGGPLPYGALAPGTICEAIHMQGLFVLTGPAFRSCPLQAVPINDRACIDIHEGAVMSYLDAVDACTEKGGRLCTWAEYFIACTVQPDMADLFNNWEWSDDTANHTHTYGQVGRTTCMSQRSVNPSVANHGAVRCCYTRP